MLFFVILFIVVCYFIGTHNEKKEQRKIENSSQIIKTFEGTTVKKTMESVEYFAMKYDLTIVDIKTTETMWKASVVAIFEH